MSAAPEVASERWAPIPSLPNYEASDRGRVRSLPRHVARNRKNGVVLAFHRGRLLTPVRISKGYLAVGIAHRPRYVHALVLEAFVGPRPDGMECCHNNGDPADNRLENLRWDTRKANAQDAIRHGRNVSLSRTHCPYGHELREPNLVVSRLPGRNCLACARARAFRQDNPTAQMQAVSDRYYEKTRP